MARRRQRKAVGLAGVERIGPCDHVQQQRQIGRAARHRSDHAEVAIGRQRRQGRWRVAAHGDEIECRLVRIDAAMKRRHAQRSADIGAERQRTITRRERRRGAAGGAARRAAEIERVVGGAVDFVIALPVAEPERHVVLAEDDAAGVLDARDRQCVFGRREILLRRNAPGRRQARDIVGFLHRHRQAEQRLFHPARQFGVGGAGSREAALEVADTDRIDLDIVALDAIDGVLGQFDRGDLFCGECGRQFDSGLEAPFRLGQGVLQSVLR